MRISLQSTLKGFRELSPQLQRQGWDIFTQDLWMNF